MKLALNIAEETANDEVPIGAVMVYEGKVIAMSQNLVITNNDPTAHAEINAIRLAAQFLQRSILNDCDLYVTLEPCAMCAQAIALAKIRRLYFGAYNPKGGGVYNGANVFRFANYVPEIYGGILENECSTVLKQFFIALRNDKNNKILP